MDICGTVFDYEANDWVTADNCLEYECLEDGQYQAKHCLGDGLCWCVDSGTGVELEGAIGSRCALHCHSNNTFSLLPCSAPTMCEQQV